MNFKYDLGQRVKFVDQWRPNDDPRTGQIVGLDTKAPEGTLRDGRQVYVIRDDGDPSQWIPRLEQEIIECLGGGVTTQNSSRSENKDSPKPKKEE